MDHRFWTTPSDDTAEIWYVTAPFPHPVDGHYVERFWLPVLGPTATLLLRRIATDHTPSSPHHHRYLSFPLDELAAGLGLGSGTAKLRRTLHRLVRYEIVHQDPDGRYTIPSHLPDVPDRYQYRWPESLQAEHLGADQLIGAELGEWS